VRSAGKISWDRSAHTHTVRPALVRARRPPCVSPRRVGVGALSNRSVSYPPNALIPDLVSTRLTLESEKEICAVICDITLPC
jgi:hypothetical protein